MIVRHNCITDRDEIYMGMGNVPFSLDLGFVTESDPHPAAPRRRFDGPEEARLHREGSNFLRSHAVSPHDFEEKPIHPRTPVAPLPRSAWFNPPIRFPSDAPPFEVVVHERGQPPRRRTVRPVRRFHHDRVLPPSLDPEGDSCWTSFSQQRRLASISSAP